MSELRNEVKIYVKICGANGEPLDDYIATVKQKLGLIEKPDNKFFIEATNAINSLRGFVKLLEQHQNWDVQGILESGNYEAFRDAIGLLDKFVWAQFPEKSAPIFATS